MIVGHQSQRHDDIHLRRRKPTHSHRQSNWLVDLSVRRLRQPRVLHDRRRDANYVTDPFGLGNIVGEYDAAGNLVAHFTYGQGLVSQTTAGAREPTITPTMPSGTQAS